MLSLFLEITNSANNRKVLCNMMNVLRIELNSNGTAQIQFQGSLINTVETYVTIRQKIINSIDNRDRVQTV